MIPNPCAAEIRYSDELTDVDTNATIYLGGVEAQTNRSTGATVISWDDGDGGYRGASFRGLNDEGLYTSGTSEDGALYRFRDLDPYDAVRLAPGAGVPQPVPVIQAHVIRGGGILAQELDAVVAGDNTVVTLMLETGLGTFVRMDGDWQQLREDSTALEDLSLVPVGAGALQVYDGSEAARKTVTVFDLPSPSPEDQDVQLMTREETPVRLNSDDPVVASGLTIPVINTADDMAMALRFASGHPASRWYVIKKAKALGVVDQIPATWIGRTALREFDDPEEDPARVRASADLYSRLCASGARPDDTEFHKLLVNARSAGLLADDAVVAAINWRSWLHPRGLDGRFIEKNGMVNVFSLNNGRGKLTDRNAKRRRAQINNLTPEGATVTYYDINGNKIPANANEGYPGMIPLQDIGDNVSTAPKSVASLRAREAEGGGPLSVADENDLDAKAGSPAISVSEYQDRVNQLNESIDGLIAEAQAELDAKRATEENRQKVIADLEASGYDFSARGNRYGLISQLPDGTVVRSPDGGQSWFNQETGESLFPDAPTTGLPEDLVPRAPILMSSLQPEEQAYLADNPGTTVVIAGFSGNAGDAYLRTPEGKYLRYSGLAKKFRDTGMDDAGFAEWVTDQKSKFTSFSAMDRTPEPNLPEGTQPIYNGLSDVNGEPQLPTTPIPVPPNPKSMVTAPGAADSPVTDEEYAQHYAYVSTVTDNALGSDLQLSSGDAFRDSATGMWSEEVLNQMMDMVDTVFQRDTEGKPRGRKAMVIAGLPASGKSTLLSSLAEQGSIREEDWVTINPDLFKEELWSSDSDLVPDVQGMTPAETAGFIHDMSSEMAYMYESLLMNEGFNIAFDVTLGGRRNRNQDGLLPMEDTFNELTLQHGYDQPDGIYIDASIQDSASRATSRHRLGLDAYRTGSYTDLNGRTRSDPNDPEIRDGGRYLPEQVVQGQVLTSSENPGGLWASQNAKNFQQLRETGAFKRWVQYEAGGVGETPEPVASWKPDSDGPNGLLPKQEDMPGFFAPFPAAAYGGPAV